VTNGQNPKPDLELGMEGGGAGMCQRVEVLTSRPIFAGQGFVYLSGVVKNMKSSTTQVTHTGMPLMAIGKPYEIPFRYTVASCDR